MKRMKPNEKLVALLTETFPDCPHHMPGIAEVLEHCIQRGPQHPPLQDQLEALEVLERSLKVAIKNFQKLEGARPSNLDYLIERGDMKNKISEFSVGLQLLHTAANKVLSHEKNRGRSIQRGRVDWHSVAAIFELCRCWRDRELSVPEEKRRKIPKAIAPGKADGAFGRFVERSFEILEVKGKPASALRAFQREYPGWSSELIGVSFTDKDQKGSDC